LSTRNSGLQQLDGLQTEHSIKPLEAKMQE